MGWDVSFFIHITPANHSPSQVHNGLPPRHPPGSRLRAGLVLQPYDGVLPPHQRHHTLSLPGASRGFFICPFFFFGSSQS